MNHDKAMKHRASLLLTAGVLVVCLGALCAISAGAQEMASKKSYLPASVPALPGLQCKVYPKGSDFSSGLAVFTDDDGYARFHAVRAAAGDVVRQLTLDCTDSAGKTYSYSVDLTSEDTFAPRPVNLANERGVDRPALKGDPMSYTQSELIDAGYGLRPDPVKDPAAYSQWLEAATRPGRLLEAKRPARLSHSVHTGPGGPWVGSVLTGSPSYISVQGNFNVPNAEPGGNYTTNTQISIWNGLGGFGTGSGLIQGGVGVTTSASVATYWTWREYCCGDPDSNGYGGNFTPNPGETIFSQEWYCDSSGNLDLNGGYGCTHLHDLTTGAVFDCTKSNGSPCWSVKAIAGMTIGLAAEFIIENESDQVSPPTAPFTDFNTIVTMTGSAYSSATDSYSSTISTDPEVNLLTDFTNSHTNILVALGSTDQTYFGIVPSFGTSSPALAVRAANPPNEVDVVVLGPNNSLMYYHATPGSKWASDTIAGYGTTYSAPAIAVRSSGEADVVAMGPDNSLIYYYALPGKPWIATTVAGPGTTYSAPAIAVRSTGEVDVVAMGPLNSLRYYHATPGEPWAVNTIGGPTTTWSAPAIVVRSTGEADVVAVGPGYSLMYYHAMPGKPWTVETILQNIVLSAPAIAVNNSTGRADIVWMGRRNSLLHTSAVPGSQWTPADMIAGQGTTLWAPAIAVRSTGEIDIATADLNGHLMYYHGIPNPSKGTAWTANTVANWAATLFTPAIVVRSNGEADIVSIGDWELDYYWATPGSSWTQSFIAGLR